MKYINSLIAMLAIMFALGTAPAMAQTTEEPAPTITEEDGEGTDGEAGDEAETDGNFSRKIPEGLKEGLTEEEISEYQARLDGAETPQERNEVRREIQRMSVERRHEGIKARQEEKQGFFSGLMNKLGEGAKKRKESDAKAAKERKEKGLSEGGGNGGGKSGGRGNGGGKGGGRNK
ncbi:MAG: hypothetical protein KAQ66_11545 [Rhodospirillaceae bacterium]|nr:hypothetical protein [Rhodospirillaceae bacterium]